MPYITKSRTSLQWHKGDKPNEGTWQQMVRLDQTGGAVAEYALRTSPEPQPVKVEYEDSTDTVVVGGPAAVKKEAVKKEEEDQFDLNNLAQSLRHNLPLEIVPKNSSTEINKVAADDKDAMFDEILRLKEQLAQISETTIKEEDNDHEGKAKFGGRKLHGRYPAFQEDCVAQKAFWNYFADLPAHMGGFNLHHLRVFVDLHVVTSKLECATNLNLSVHFDTNLQQISFDRKQLRIFSFFKNLLQSGEDWTADKIMEEAKRVDRTERQRFRNSATCPPKYSSLNRAQTSRPVSIQATTHTLRSKGRKCKTARICIHEESHRDQMRFEANFQKYLDNLKASSRRSAARCLRLRNQEMNKENARERLELGINRRQQRALHAERKQTADMLSNLLGEMEVVDRGDYS